MVLLPPAPVEDSAGTPAGAGSAVNLDPAPVPVADTDDTGSGGRTGTDGGDPATTLPPPTSLVVTVPAPEAPTPSAAGLPTTSPSAPAGGAPSAITVDDNEVWVVDAGDSFWSIAEDVVGLGRRTQAYWEQLIAANRHRLAVPDQPDLLFPGQRLTLPPPVPREG
jgi:nucleoid-associated protein YgaU